MFLRAYSCLRQLWTIILKNFSSHLCRPSLRKSPFRLFEAKLITALYLLSILNKRTNECTINLHMCNKNHEQYNLLQTGKVSIAESNSLTYPEHYKLHQTRRYTLQLEMYRHSIVNTIEYSRNLVSSNFVSNTS